MSTFNIYVESGKNSFGLRCHLQRCVNVKSEPSIFVKNFKKNNILREEFTMFPVGVKNCGTISVCVLSCLCLVENVHLHTLMLWLSD